MTDAHDNANINPNRDLYYRHPDYNTLAVTGAEADRYAAPLADVIPLDDGWDRCGGETY